MEAARKIYARTDRFRQGNFNNRKFSPCGRPQHPAAGDKNWQEAPCGTHTFSLHKQRCKDFKPYSCEQRGCSNHQGRSQLRRGRRSIFPMVVDYTTILKSGVLSHMIERSCLILLASKFPSLTSWFCRLTSLGRFL